MSKFLLEVDLAIELGVEIVHVDEELDDGWPPLDAFPLVAAETLRWRPRASTRVLVQLDLLEELVLQIVALAFPMVRAGQQRAHEQVASDRAPVVSLNSKHPMDPMNAAIRIP